MEDYKNYNVILCDIKGVGQKIDSKLDGIAVARDIKKVYPEIIVLQYSGQVVYDYDPKFYDNMIIDGFVEKSQSSKELADELDNYCSLLWDPKAAWKYIEKSLRRLEIDNINIAYFENLYVKSLENRNDYISKKTNGVRLTAIKNLAYGLLQMAITIINNYNNGQ